MAELRTNIKEKRKIMRRAEKSRRRRKKRARARFKVNQFQITSILLSRKESR